MEKKHFEYSLQLQGVSADEPVSTQISFTNHDDIFRIIGLIEQKGIFPTASDAAEFAIGLKLFTEVILRNRSLELFKELQPALQKFMVQLKKYNAAQ